MNDFIEISIKSTRNIKIPTNTSIIEPTKAGFSTNDRLVLRGTKPILLGKLNVVSERLFIQPMLWGNWLYRLWADVPANRVCLAV